MIIQIIKLKSGLGKDALLEKAQERAPKFKAIPGLLQKYYVDLDDEGAYAGVYIWDSPESLQEFRSSELAASIPAAYELAGPPDIEVGKILFSLRE